MSSSELRYLIAANELAEQMEIVKQTDVANKLNVSKVSTYNAIERLRDKGFIEKNDRKIVLTDRGKEVLNEYRRRRTELFSETYGQSDVGRNGPALRDRKPKKLYESERSPQSDVQFRVLYADP